VVRFVMRGCDSARFGQGVNGKEKPRLSTGCGISAGRTSFTATRKLRLPLPVFEATAGWA